ncbi:MAG TPA: Tat pathway signal protein [Natrialbaceae archaeon]|nr:Tat pathway signal protein [Natrialbaceae archaeon]
MAFGSDLSRREFARAAVATGGAAALSACLDVFGDEPIPKGVEDPSTLPERQHAWNDRVRHDDHGNEMLPKHQLLLYLTLDADGPPTDEERSTVEAALTTLDRAYERSHEGLLYSVGYSPAYFDRFDESLPPEIDLPAPRRLSSFETPTFDTQDAQVHLASDRADAVLAAEAALTGERSSLNGVEVESALTDVLSVDDRRSGFVGEGLPAKHQDVEGIPDSKPVPEASPLFMGFKAGFRQNQATEDYVTIQEGPFAGGTTKHLATLRQRLEDWYEEQTFDERVMEMFSPAHAERGLVEGVGENLGDDNGLTPEIIETIVEQATEFGRVGHAQKAARANRDGEGNVRTLRRHFESTDHDVASLHFPSLQREISTFEAVRRAMNGADLTDNPAIRQRVNNGILEYVFVEHRGNFLVPPRRLRALPPARPTSG